MFHDRDRGRGDTDPFGVVKAQQAYGIGHKVVIGLAAFIDLGQGPTVGGKDERRRCPVNARCQKVFELLAVYLVVFNQELRKTKIVRFECVDKAAKALDAAGNKPRRGGNDQKPSIAFFDACLDGAVRSFVIIRLDPVGAKVVQLGIDKNEGLAAVADRFANFLKAGGRLHDKAVDAQRDKAIDVGELILLVKIGGADQHTVALLAGDGIDAFDQLVCKRVGDVADDYTDHLAILGIHAAGEGTWLIPGIVDGLADARLRVVAHAVGLAI